MRPVLVLITALFAASLVAGCASFAPQANWKNAGAECAATRKAPAERWRTIPPRGCAAH